VTLYKFRKLKHPHRLDFYENVD